eukprot:scaffold44667_cov29-Phaeocystis_antarctica.AAC.3
MEALSHAALRRPNRAREAPGPAPPAESATPQSRRGCRSGTHGVCRGMQRGVQGRRRCCGGGGCVWGCVWRWDTEGTHGAQRLSCEGAEGVWMPPAGRRAALYLV